MTLRIPPHLSATRPLNAAEINACLLYRDAMILVLNKPAGIAVHITGHDKLSLDQSFQHLQFGLPKHPCLAHRLDRGTSGCLVLGRHRQALIKLGKLFEKQRVTKAYRAICMGVPEQAEGTIDRSILKSGLGSQWKMSLDEAGQKAITDYKVLKTFRHPGLAAESVLSEIMFFPKTGRTHQIRLHAAFALGCPVLGDPFYGPAEGPFSASYLPMMLHGETIEIPLQPNKAAITVTAPLPEHMRMLLHSASI